MYSVSYDERGMALDGGQILTVGDLGLLSKYSRVAGRRKQAL